MSDDSRTVMNDRERDDLERQVRMETLLSQIDKKVDEIKVEVKANKLIHDKQVSELENRHSERLSSLENSRSEDKGRRLATSGITGGIAGLIGAVLASLMR